MLGTDGGSAGAAALPRLGTVGGCAGAVLPMLGVVTGGGGAPRLPRLGTVTGGGGHTLDGEAAWANISAADAREARTISPEDSNAGATGV